MPWKRSPNDQHVVFPTFPSVSFRFFLLFSSLFYFSSSIFVFFFNTHGSLFHLDLLHGSIPWIPISSWIDLETEKESRMDGGIQVNHHKKKKNERDSFVVISKARAQHGSGRAKGYASSFFFPLSSILEGYEEGGGRDQEGFLVLTCASSS